MTMKTLIAAIFALSASSALAQAPCENPTALPCQKACAVIGAKLVLAERQNAGATVRLTTLSSESAPDSAQRLARLAGVSLIDIDRMTLRDASDGVANSCPRPQQ